MSSATKIWCPTKPSEVTPEWLQAVMTEALKSDAKVLDLVPITDNNGFLSSIFRAKVQSLDGGIINVFVKIGMEFGKANPEEEQFIRATNVDLAEVDFYKGDLAQLIAFEKQHLGTSEVEDILPKIYSCDYNDNPDHRGVYLVMEDLSVDFTKIELGPGATFVQLKVLVESLARFHAISYCYGKIKGITYDPKIRKLPFDGFLCTEEIISKMPGWLEMAIEDFGNHEVGRNLVPYLEKMSRHWQDSMAKGFAEESENRFLTHGDLWVNNVMVRKDDAACKIFDWQFLCAKAPYIDFTKIVAYGAEPVNVKAWWDDLVNVYMNKMESTCKHFDLKPPFSREEFNKSLFREGFFPIFCMIMLGYDILCRDPKLKMFERFVWVTEMAVKHSPESF